MTAIQILEKLGADASSNVLDLNHKEKKSITQVLSKTQHFNAIQSQTSPEPDEREEDEDEDEDEENKEEKSA